MKNLSIIFFLFALPFCGIAQVGIGTTDPNTKAALDISSTTQGLLPPRMNSTQRAAITFPPTGLLVFQTDAESGLYYYTGSLWTIVNASPCGYAIGQFNSSLGGYIFYLDQSGCHGLVAALNYYENNYKPWYNGTYTNTTAFASSVGGGDGNTNLIVYNQGGVMSSYAAGFCYELNVEGFSDWFLPSKYELNLMFTNIGPPAPAPNNNVGHFSDDVYWSSSEVDSTTVWCQDFTNGDQLNLDKHYTNFYVRPIRAF